MAIKLTKELLTTEAEKQAIVLVNNGDAKITTTQIRKFYNDFLVLKNKSDMVSEEDFRNDIFPMICFSKAKLAYAYGRGNAKIAKEFVDDINKKIDSIESKSDFNNFINYYQALIGYATYQFEINKSEKDRHRDDSNNRNNHFRR